MEDTPSYYSIITADVRYDKKLKPMEKILYSEITALANKNGYCNAKNKYFAELYDVHKDTVSDWIKNLKNQGHIEVELIYEGKRVIERRIYPIGKNTDRYRQKDLEGIGKNTEDNNTRYNIEEEEKEKSQDKKDAIVDFYNNNIGMISPFVFELINHYREKRFRR